MVVSAGHSTSAWCAAAPETLIMLKLPERGRVHCCWRTGFRSVGCQDAGSVSLTSVQLAQLAPGMVERGGVFTPTCSTACNTSPACSGTAVHPL
eukprot:1234663-Amphidinium_carterae.1